MDIWKPEDTVKIINPYGEGPFTLRGIDFLLVGKHRLTRRPLFFIKCGPRFQHWWSEEEKHFAMRFHNIVLRDEYLRFLLTDRLNGRPEEIGWVEIPSIVKEIHKKIIPRPKVKWYQLDA